MDRTTSANTPLFDDSSFEQAGERFTDPRLESSIIERHDKLMLTMTMQGMIPHGYRELNHAATLLEDRFELGGSAKYMAIISRHLRKYEPETDEKIPAAGLKPADKVYLAMTSEFVSYFDDALATVKSLHDLKGQLSRQNPGGRTGTFGESRLMQAWRDDESLRRAVGTLLRYEDAMYFMSNLGDDRLGTDYTQPDELTAHRETYLVKDMKVREMQKRITNAMALEGNRARFWDEQLYGREADRSAGQAARRGVVDVQFRALQDYLQRRVHRSSAR